MRTEVTRVIGLYADWLIVVTVYVRGNIPSNVNEDITLLAKVVSSHDKKRTSSTAPKTLHQTSPSIYLGQRTSSMRKVREHIAIIQTGHSNLRYYHLQERGERRENAKLVWSEAKSGSCGEVAAFHDSRRDEHLRMFLMNPLQSGRSLKIA